MKTRATFSVRTIGTILLALIFSFSATTQVVDLPVLQANGQASYSGNTIVTAGAGTTSCNGNTGVGGGTGTAQAMGRSAGLTITVTPNNQSNTAWGVDLSKFYYSFVNTNTNYLNIISNTSRNDVSTNTNNSSSANYYDDITTWGPETNLTNGDIVLRGWSNITFYNTSSTIITRTVPVRYILKFSKAVKRNGNIAYIDMTGTTAFTVNIKAQVDASYISNQAGLWTASCAGHTGWQPALTVFDDLATTTANNVLSGFSASWYDLSQSYTVSNSTPSGVTFGSQTPASYTNPVVSSVVNTGIEIAGRPGGVTYTVSNTGTGCYGFGFDGSSGFGYSYQNGATTSAGVMSAVSVSESDFNSGKVVLYSGSNIDFYNTSGGLTNATVGLRYTINFMNNSNAAIACKWQNGKIFVPITNGGGVAKIKIVAEANAYDLRKNISGTNQTPNFVSGAPAPYTNYTANTANWVPALDLYDWLSTY